MCTCVITSGPNIFPEAADIAFNCDRVICADGGVDYALKYGIPFDTVYGDFDSISEEGMRYINEHKNEIDIKTFKVDKDKTDTELILRDLPVDEDILLICPLMGRPDHVLANISLAVSISDDKRGITLTDGMTDIIPITNSETISLKLSEGYEKKVISLIPLSTDEKVSGVTTQGLFFELNDGELTYGDTLGIHNRLKPGCNSFSITVKKGKMLLIITEEE